MALCKRKGSPHCGRGPARSDDAGTVLPWDSEVARTYGELGAASVPGA